MNDKLSLDYHQLDDASLMRLMALGKKDALAALYDRYGGLVFSVAFHVCGERGAAEEITQDAFLRAWENAAAYRVELARVSTWLVNIARNRGIDLLRSRKARPEQHAVAWADVNPADLSAGNNPEEDAGLRIERQRVRSAVAQLPQEQRQALALAYFKGMSHREIAEALDEPLGTVKTRIRLGMQKLRHTLNED